jgi:alpha-mannosidase
VYPDAEVYHTSIDNIDAAVDEYYNELPQKAGELNETTKIYAGYAHLISNTLSSRYPIKKYNDRMQTKLEKWVSPLYAFRKTSAPYGFLDLANKFLTQNHPHDSICGCSIDQVHKDMMYRFDQTSLIAEEIVGPFCGSLGGDISSFATTSNTSDTDHKLFRIFNPLPYSAHRMVEATVRFEGGFQHYAEPFGYENIASFKIYDADENEIPYGIVDINGETYRIAFEADLTASGITEFKAVPQAWPSRYTDRLPQTVNSAEGEKIAVFVNCDGTINLTDKVTGEVYENLMTLIDDGEIGDGWFHCNPAIDKIITNSEATIEKVENNCNRITFRVVQKMMLPKEMKWENGGIHRSSEYEEFNVENFITISRTERYLNVKTIINNKIKDHRLRMRFPTAVEGETYNVNQPFGFVERRTGTDPGTENWKEFGVVEKQTGGIVAKRTGKRGFAFVSAYGIHECGVWENGNMDITMYRSFRKTVGTSGEPDGQLIETLEFSYMLMPFVENETLAQLQRKQDFLQTGFSYATTNGRAAQKYRPAAELENENFIYSTANVLDNGASEIRIYNASDRTETSKVLLPEFAKTAALTEIDGRHIKDLEICDGAVSLTLGKWKIATVMFM